MLPISHKNRGFSLIEVLVALVILVFVGSAYVALSNSLVRGTITVSDKTITSQWAREAIERVVNIRDQNVLRASSDGWLKQAGINESSGYDNYGWYKLGTNSADDSWELKRVEDINTDNRTEIFYEGSDGGHTGVFDAGFGEALTSGNLNATRFVCIESFAAQDIPTDIDQNSIASARSFHCNENIDPDGNFVTVKDGNRSLTSLSATSECAGVANTNDGVDQFCKDTFGVINKYHLDSATSPNPSYRAILPGNAVKLKVLIVWQDQDQIKSYTMHYLLTNWQAYESIDRTTP